MTSLWLYMTSLFELSAACDLNGVTVALYDVTITLYDITMTLYDNTV